MDFWMILNYFGSECDRDKKRGRSFFLRMDAAIRRIKMKLARRHRKQVKDFNFQFTFYSRNV